MINLFDEIFITKNRDEWETLLNAADIANEKILHWSDVSTDKQALENDYIYEVEYANGETSNLVRTPVDFNSVKREKFVSSAKIGEHTEEVLEQLGYNEEEITNFKENKDIK